MKELIKLLEDIKGAMLLMVKLKNMDESTYKIFDESISEAIALAKNNIVQPDVMLSGWQACPKCNGQGTVQKPPQVCGDVDHWISDATQYGCNVCDGKKIISTATGCPPASH